MPADRTRNLHLFSGRQTSWAFIIILFLSIWVLNANPFSGQTVGPFDLLLAQPGWETIPWDNKVLNTEASDVLDSQLPLWITLKEQIRSGKGALWYPYAAGGKETDLVPYNPAFLLFLIIGDNAVAYYMVALFKLIMSGLGCYLLLKTFLKWLPSLWGGLVFMLCGFNVAWFFYEQVTTAMWIPWLLASTVMYLRTDDIKWLPVVTASAALLVLGGFLSVAAFGLYAFALLVLTWNAYDFFVRYRHASVRDNSLIKIFLEKSALPLLASGIGLVLAAVGIISFFDGLTGINLSYRTGGTHFQGMKDLLLLFYYEHPIHIEKTSFIGIPVVILAFIGIGRFFSASDDGYRKFILFNVLLVFMSTLITFGLLPHDLIRALPIFSNNPWNRLLVVLLLGLAVLSAVGLDFIMTALPDFVARRLKMAPIVARRAVMLLVIVLAAFQFGSQKVFFNDCVAVVPSAWFYPATPSIKYVKERLKPLQSVIADNSFSISGGLGAYGIPEWYGHSLFTDREKEVLGNLVMFPFGSPTSAFFDAANIQFNSPLMDKMLIKYLLIDKNRALHKTLRSPSPVSSDLAPPMPLNSWRQRIYIENDMAMDGISFFFNTFGEANAPANIRLKLVNQNGEQLVESDLDKYSVTDNSWGFFDFREPLPLKRGFYYMELSLPGYAGPGRLTALASKNHHGGAGSDYLEINGDKTDASLQWEIAYYERVSSNVFGSRWNFIDLENNIAVLENNQVTNSAYVVRDLDPLNDQIDFSGLDVSRPSSDEINIAYSNFNPGWVILPVRRRPGWNAYVDDRQVAYDTYLGILPAIPVNGSSRISFRYEPESFSKGLTISVVGFCIFLAFSFICLKKSKGTRFSKRESR